MKIRQNFHIHSHHSCDSACATMQNIIADASALNIEQYGVTDHLHTRYNLSDIVSSRHDFLGTMPPDNFHFGMEVTCMATWECERIAAGDYFPWGDEPIYGFRNDERPFDGRMSIDISETEIREIGIKFVIGGVHWPQGFPRGRSEAIENYLQQQLFLISDSRVDVLAHPWDSLELAAGDWYRHRDANHKDWDAYHFIPAEFDLELAQALLHFGKAAEINLPCCKNAPDAVREKMFRRFVVWKEIGVKFTIGDDLHGAHSDPELFAWMEKQLKRWNFNEADFILPFEVPARNT